MCSPAIDSFSFGSKKKRTLVDFLEILHVFTVRFSMLHAALTTSARVKTVRTNAAPGSVRGGL